MQMATWYDIVRHRFPCNLGHPSGLDQTLAAQSLRPRRVEASARSILGIRSILVGARFHVVRPPASVHRLQCRDKRRKKEIIQNNKERSEIPCLPVKYSDQNKLKTPRDNASHPPITSRATAVRISMLFEPICVFTRDLNLFQ